MEPTRQEWKDWAACVRENPPRSHKFSTSGTFTIPNNVTSLTITVIPGGGVGWYATGKLHRCNEKCSRVNVAQTDGIGGGSGSGTAFIAW